MHERRWIKAEELAPKAHAKRCVILLMEAAISVTAAITAVVNGIQGDPENRLFTCVCTAVFMWVPHVIERAAKHRFSVSQHAAYIIMLTGSALIGSAFNVFNKVGWYDCAMHFLSGYVMMIFIIIPFAGKLNKAEEGGRSERKSGLATVLVLFLCSLGTAAVWEIMEFTVDLLAGQSSQGHVPPEVIAMLEEQGITGIRAAWEGMKYVSVLDTDLDMLCHTGGTLVFCLHYIIHLLTGKSLGMKFLISDIYGRDMNEAEERAAAAEKVYADEKEGSR